VTTWGGPPHPPLAAASPRGERLGQCVADGLENDFEIFCYVGVPEAKHAKAFSSQPCVPLEVVRAVHVMESVSFNNDFVFEAHEIRDETPNRFLSLKLRAQLRPTQSRPQQHLRRRLPLPQLPRPRCQPTHSSHSSLSPLGEAALKARVRGSSPLLEFRKQVRYG
jgi:hypothetical protein